MARRQQGMTSWREQFDALAEQYALHFAGQTRLTRNLDMLDHLIGALDDFGLTAPEPLSGEAQQTAVQWRAERAAVAAAQESAGPAGRSAARIMTRALFSWHRYQRHFAGLPRQGRDLGLLADIVADLQQASTAISALAPSSADLQVLKTHLALAQQEQRALRDFVEQGNAEQQAAAWASIANTLFTTFHAQFMQRHRLSCRPALLARLCEGLAVVHQQMSTLFADTPADSDHAQNIAAVAQELAEWRNELTQIEQAQKSADADERVTILNEAAEALLEEYNQQIAGIEHDNLPTAAVATLCDRLDEIERQMTALENLPGLTENAHNVGMVRDALDMLCDVFDVAARRSAPPAPAPHPAPAPAHET